MIYKYYNLIVRKPQTKTVLHFRPVVLKKKKNSEKLQKPKDEEDTFYIPVIKNHMTFRRPKNLNKNKWINVRAYNTSYV